MIGIRNKEIFKSDRITKLIEEVNKPMSLNEIMYKFNVNYPFKVKCVKEFYNVHDGSIQSLLGRTLTYYKNSSRFPASALSLEIECYSQNRDSKKFKYIP